MLTGCKGIVRREVRLRLFVAVDIDDRTRAQLARAQEVMQSVLLKARVPPRVTWVNPDAAHVTLRFIGEVPETAVHGLSQALLCGFDIAPFEVRWQRAGTFPQGNRPRVVWIGAEDDSAVAALAEKVNARLLPLLGSTLSAGPLAPARLPRRSPEGAEAGPFKAHLTLGRVKEPGRSVNWTEALTAVRWKPTTTRIDHITMYSSRTSPKGPTYTALCRVDL